MEIDEHEMAREGDPEAAFSHLPPGTPHLPPDTPKPERVLLPLISIAPLSLVHLLLASPFLSPENTWHLLVARVQSLGIAQWVGPFMEWIGACTVASPSLLDALVRVDLADTAFEQRHGIRKLLVTSLPPLSPQVFHPPAGSHLPPEVPAPLPAPNMQPVTPADHW